MDEKTKKDLQDGGKHIMHGVEDVAEVIGHGVTGAVKGAADGVETDSAQTKTRKAESD